MNVVANSSKVGTSFGIGGGSLSASSIFFRSIASAAAFVLTGGVPDRLMTRLSILSCFRNRHRLVLSL